MRLMRFKPKAEYVPRKEPVVAHTLSRNPLSVPFEAFDTDDLRAYVDTAEMVWPVSTEKMESIKSATYSDPQLSRVLDHTVNGWP